MTPRGRVRRRPHGKFFSIAVRAPSASMALTFWIDPAKKAALEQAMKAGKTYPVDTNLDKDFYGVREKFK